MKRAVCAIFLTTLVASSSQAGYVGQINLGGSTPDPTASLGVMGTGANSTLVGTGLLASTITNASGVISSPGGGYMFFTTGTYAGTDASGDTLYNAGGDFYILQQNLAASQPVYARDLTTGMATVSTLAGQFDTIGSTAYQEYQLTMGFSSAIINPPVSTSFGSPTPGLYSGTVTFTYIIDPDVQGNQLLSGSITFNSIPEPSSVAMVLIGGVGLLGYGRRHRRFSRAA